MWTVNEKVNNLYTVTDFPCKAEQNTTQNLSLATQKSPFAAKYAFSVHKISTVYIFCYANLLDKMCWAAFKTETGYWPKFHKCFKQYVVSTGAPPLIC